MFPPYGAPGYPPYPPPYGGAPPPGYGPPAGYPPAAGASAYPGSPGYPGAAGSPYGAYPPGYGPPPGSSDRPPSRERERERDRSRGADRNAGGGGQGRRGNRGGNKKADTNTKDSNSKETKGAAEDAAAAAGSSSQKQQQQSGPPDALSVSACKSATITKILQGDFLKSGDNHGKAVYKKTSKVNDLDVMLYYWDDRDGASFCGWWFGPKVGGDQVWAYHGEKATAPPVTGWKVPFDGDVDMTFTVQGRYTGGGGGKKDRRQRGQQDKKVDGEERRRQLEEQKRQIEAMRKKNEEELKKKAEEQKQAEDARRRSEEEAKRREEEEKKKREAEEARKQEQKSVLAIRRIIQKVRSAVPENFVLLKQELEEVLAQELESAGTQKQRMREESDKGLEQAKARVEQIDSSRRKDQEKREEDLKVKRAAVAKTKMLILDLTCLIVSAEEMAKKLKDTASPLQTLESDLSVDEVEKVAEGVENTGLMARAASKACTDFVLKKGLEIKEGFAPVQGEANETKAEVAKLLQRINTCMKTCEGATNTARSAKTSAVQRASARQKKKNMEQTFKKYDQDGDGMLSRSEVANLATGEYNFTVPEDTLDKIWHVIVEEDEGATGIRFDRFQLLYVMIGAARERDRDAQRRVLREERECRIQAIKADITEKMKGVAEATEEADKVVEAAEEKVQPLQIQARTMTSTEMEGLAEQVEESIKESRRVVALAKSQLEALSQGFEPEFAKELKVFVHSEAKQLDLRVGRMESRLSRTANLCSRFRDQAQRKRVAEEEQLKLAAVEVIRYNQIAKHWSREDLFEQFDRDKDGEISLDDFVAFFDAADLEIRDLRGRRGHHQVKVELATTTEAATSSSSSAPAAGVAPAVKKVELTKTVLERLFKEMLEEGQEKVSRDALIRLVRLFFKVVKETALTDVKSIKDSQVLRRLELNEVVEVYEGPILEESAEVLRIRCKICGTDHEGWATVEGNQGTQFLKEGGGQFTVVKETILTDCFSLSDEKEHESSRKLKDTTRKVKEGEILEVWQWPRKEESSGLIRMRCRVKNGGAVGWVTTMGNQGAVFAEML